MKLWNWLSGKKTAIAALYWAIQANVVPIWFGAGLPEPWNRVNLTVGTLLTILGLGHATLKMLGRK